MSIKKISRDKPAIGAKYLCVRAESSFFLAGKIYTIVANTEGDVGFIAEDGLFDKFGMTASKFLPKD